MEDKTVMGKRRTIGIKKRKKYPSAIHTYENVCDTSFWIALQNVYTLKEMIYSIFISHCQQKFRVQ